MRAAQRVVEDLFGQPSARSFTVRYWDGTAEPPASGGQFTLVIARPAALRRMLVPPSELAIAESYIFFRRYVFPDGLLVPTASVIASAERAGFELRDVESLREHYVTTLRHWVRRLEQHADAARAIVGDPTYRVWRLYMSGAAHGFRIGRIGVIQSLLAKKDVSGHVGLPRNRADLYR